MAVFKKQYLWNAVKYGLGIALLVWVIWAYWKSPDGGRSPGLEDALQQPLSYGPLLLALVICLGSLLLTFARWFLLVRAQDLPFQMGDAMRLGWIGYALNTFLPGSIGGDIIKAAFLAREQNRRTVAVATVVFDRIIGLCGLFWLVAVLGVFFWVSGLLEVLAPSERGRNALVAIFSGAVLLAVGSLLFWLLVGLVPRSRIEPLAQRLNAVPKIGHSLAEIWRALHMYRARSHSVRQALLLALLGHVGFVLTFHFCALTLCPAESVPNLASQYLVVPVGMTIQAGIPTPGGVGGAEWSFGALYDAAGYGFTTGVLASLVQRLITWVLGLVGYLTYLRMKPSLPLAEAEALEAANEVAGSPGEDNQQADPLAARVQPGPTSLS